MKRIALLLCLIVATLPLYSQQRPAHTDVLVPDAETAIALAKVILKPIYGENFVKRKTFTAEKRDGQWLVKGRPKVPAARVVVGGTIEMQIDMRDATVTGVFLSL